MLSVKVMSITELSLLGCMYVGREPLFKTERFLAKRNCSSLRPLAFRSADPHSGEWALQSAENQTGYRLAAANSITEVKWGGNRDSEESQYQETMRTHPCLVLVSQIATETSRVHSEATGQIKALR